MNPLGLRVFSRVVFLAVSLRCDSVLSQPEPQVAFGTNPRHDLELTQSQLCEACNAIVMEVDKQIFGERTEPKIYDALDGVCQEKNLRIYKFIPPKMKQACDKVLDMHSDDFEDKLLLGGDDLGRRVCGEICGDVVFNPPPTKDELAARQPPKKRSSKKRRKKKKKRMDEL